MENPFHIETDQLGFESFSKSNGFKYWWASTLMPLLGYSTMESFRKAINKAMIACDSLGIPLVENFVNEKRELDGKEFYDYKLSRFACYLTAMNGDVKKPEVARAQAYFITFADACRLYLEQAEGIERVGLRAEVSEHEKSLSGVANHAHVHDYALFQSAGYRGLYNMDMYQLRAIKCVPKGRSPLDFMGREELAANIFRITQTELKIKQEGIKGQARLEATANLVGQKVRQTMRELSGTRPEDLPPARDIKEVKKKLKSAHREFRKLDKPKSSNRNG